MKLLDDALKACDLAFLKILNPSIFRSRDEHKVLIENLEKQLEDSRTRGTHVYIWENGDIPNDVAAIVIVRPGDAKTIREANDRHKQLREFVEKPTKRRKA